MADTPLYGIWFTAPASDIQIVESGWVYNADDILTFNTAEDARRWLDNADLPLPLRGYYTVKPFARHLP